MATQSTAVFRCRTGGNAANGAGYDPGISGAGTDYSQQDAAQLTLSDVACSNTTTVTSATGGFTAAMIGNAIRITGGGSTTGYYWITARASTNSVTVDRSPGTVAAGSGRVGGACSGDFLNTLGSSLVPGNTVSIRATAGNAASWPTTGMDYTIASFLNPPNGSAAAGYIRWVGENGVPTIGCPGLTWYSMNFHSFEGLYLLATSNANTNNGIINGSNHRVTNCLFNLNNQAQLPAINCGALAMDGGEVYGGTATPSFSAGAYGIDAVALNGVIRGVKVHHCRDSGIRAAEGTVVSGNRIYLNAGNGVEGNATGSTTPGVIAGNTIDANAGHGVSITAVAGAPCYEIANNCITNHAGSGKAGISYTDGTTAVNDARKRFADYNNLFGNAGAYANVSAGAHDLALNPGYASASAGDFTPSNTSLQAGV